MLFGCSQLITMVTRNSLHFFVVFWFAGLKRLLHALNYSVPLWKISVLSQGMEIESGTCLLLTLGQVAHLGLVLLHASLYWTNTPEPLLWIKLRSCSGLDLISIISWVSFNPSQLFPLALGVEQETRRQRSRWKVQENYVYQNHVSRAW